MMSDKNTKSESSWKTLIITTCAFSTVGILFLGFSSYIIENYWSGTLSLKSLAEIGATYGVLAALFTGLAFAGLIVTIAMQREDLSLQRKELRESTKIAEAQYKEYKRQSELINRQQFEHTFFKLIEFYQIKKDEISFHRSKDNFKDKGKWYGDRAIEEALKEIHSEFSIQITSSDKPERLKTMAQRVINGNPERECIARIIYSQQEGLFSSINNALALIDYLEKNYPENETFQILLSNCINDNEKIIIFYFMVSNNLSSNETEIFKNSKLFRNLDISLMNMFFSEHYYNLKNKISLD